MILVFFVLVATIHHQQSAADGSELALSMSIPIIWLNGTVQTVHAITADSSGPFYYLLASIPGSRLLSALRIAPDGTINWQTQLRLLPDTGSNFLNNPLIDGTKLAKPKLLFDRATKSLIASGWTTTTATADNLTATNGYLIPSPATRITTTPSTIQLSNFFWSDVCWSPELQIFVAVGMAVYQMQGGIIVSADGYQWTPVLSPMPYRLRAVAWSSKLQSFAAVGYDLSTAVVLTSPNGTVWTKQTLGGAKPLYEFRYVIWSPLQGGCFVAVGGNPTIDGWMAWAVSCGSPSNWVFNAVAVPNILYFNGIAAAEELNVVLAAGQASSGSSGLLFYSEDGGSSWAQQDPLVVEGVAFRSVAWSPVLRRFVAVGLVSEANPLLRIAVSDRDSYRSWRVCNSQDDTKTSAFLGVRWNRELQLFIVVSTDQLGMAYLVTSADGETWTKHQGLFGPDFATKFAYYSASRNSLVVAGYNPSTFQSQIYVTQIYFPSNGSVICLNPQDGAIKWSSEYGMRLDTATLPSGLLISSSGDILVSGTRFSSTNGGFQGFIIKLRSDNGEIIANISLSIDADFIPLAAASILRQEQQEADYIILAGYISQLVSVAQERQPFIRRTPAIVRIQSETLQTVEWSFNNQTLLKSAGYVDAAQHDNEAFLLLKVADGNWSLTTLFANLSNSSNDFNYNEPYLMLMPQPESDTINNNSIIGIRNSSNGITVLMMRNHGDLLNYTEQIVPLDFPVYLQSVAAYRSTNRNGFAVAGLFSNQPGILNIMQVLFSANTTTTTTATFTSTTSPSLLPPPTEATNSNSMVLIAAIGTVFVVITTTALIIWYRKRNIKPQQITDSNTSVSAAGIIGVSGGITSTISMQPSNAAIEMSSLNCDGMRIPSPVSASLVPYFIGELPAGAAAQVEDNIFQYPIDVDPNNAAGNYIAETDNDNNSTTVTLYTSQNRGLYVPGNYLLSANTATYRPVKMVYVNSNCEVHRAQVLDHDLRTRCRSDFIAVKVIKKLNAHLVEAFYQEISIMYFFIGKPNFVQLVGFCNAPYQLMTEYYELGNLEQVLLSGRSNIQSTLKLLLSFGLQIGGAIALMHEKGFAHSDIKALNVFVDRDYWGKLQCYLGDFGLAQILDDSHLIVKAYRVFNIKGLTIPYAAPEVLQRFRSLDPAQINLSWKAGDFQQADVYSYAVLLYEIVNCVYAWEWDVCGNK